VRDFSLTIFLTIVIFETAPFSFVSMGYTDYLTLKLSFGCADLIALAAAYSTGKRFFPSIFGAVEVTPALCMPHVFPLYLAVCLLCTGPLHHFPSATNPHILQ
jgi:hypothetical protein